MKISTEVYTRIFCTIVQTNKRKELPTRKANMDKNRPHNYKTGITIARYITDKFYIILYFISSMIVLSYGSLLPIINFDFRCPQSLYSI